ncbi:acetolactate synthase-1/2/3 large subunit [Actinokineospora baliensis]|uniref:thiamine pyrophosphate-binding protein n=1 Tax=Actinokineospora baliensis TaxID=547056 RepID=UPI00195C78C1|nr:thiamine pyrophosphate-binding protein [Actinokineospora baliensis]MBM7774725.1 acetolactate synthase-1/2/3 large subunit [Actinokineospora baliensis]
MTDDVVDSPLSTDIDGLFLQEIDDLAHYEELRDVTPAELVLRYLRLEGVTTIFGVPGASLVLILDKLRRESGPRYVIARHESGAAYMADGYARVGERELGVVLVTSGPGATNALTGAMNAHNNGTPLLTLAGEAPRVYFGKGFLQEGVDGELDVHAVYRAANGYSVLVDDAGSFPTLFQQALRDARSVPGAAVHVSLPSDVSAQVLPRVQFPTSTGRYRVTPSNDDTTGVSFALHRLLLAERPLILLGNGCRYALRDRSVATRFQRFVERFEIPVMTTPAAKGLFPESHYLSLRNYGVSGCPWAFTYVTPQKGLPDYDGLLVLGSKLGQAATSSTLLPANTFDRQLVPARGPFIQVDLDPAVIGRSFPITQGIVADIGRTIGTFYAKGMVAEVPGSAKGRREWIAQIKRTFSSTLPPAVATAGTAPVDRGIAPTDLMSAINATLPAESHVFVDSGNCAGWSLHYLTIDPPAEMHNSPAMAPMGFAVSAVVGAKLAQPRQTCVAITGDAAFLMHGSEVSTAAHNEVAAVWVVLNDDSHVMADQGMARFDPGQDWTGYYSIGKPDLVAYARSLGADAWSVSAPEHLAKTLTEAFTAKGTKPRVVVVAIDPKPVPPYYEYPLTPLVPLKP